MKRKVLFGILCVLFICSVAYAKEEIYIVQFNDKMQLFDTDFENLYQSKNYVTATYEELQGYLADGIVEYYEPDYKLELSETFTSETEADFQWNLDAVKIEKPWNIGCYGNDVVVGVIDSGCYNHPDLKNNLLSGRNYTSSDIADTADKIGHGTYVSGIIAAECNGEYTDGIAHKAKIVPLKCFDSGVVTQTSMVSDAVYDAIDIYGCDVINMSFEIPKSKVTKTLENAIKYAIRNGCIVVAAVGNDGTETECYPAKYDNVIGVGSVDENGEVSYFSQHNLTVDFVAPGENIKSVSVSGYESNSGTSFAAPHVSAMAAIAKCINKNITAQEFTEILINSARHPNDTDYTEKQYDVYYGYGLVDAEKMFDELVKSKKYFLSPVSVINNQLSTVVYNNSDKKLIAKSILSNCSGNAFNNAVITDLNIPSGEYFNIQCELPKDNLKIMIWSDMTTIMPLVPYRTFTK